MRLTLLARPRRECGRQRDEAGRQGLENEQRMPKTHGLVQEADQGWPAAFDHGGRI